MIVTIVFVFCSAGNNGVHPDAAILQLLGTHGLHLLACDGHHRILLRLLLRLQDLRCNQDWLISSVPICLPAYLTFFGEADTLSWALAAGVVFWLLLRCGESTGRPSGRSETANKTNLRVVLPLATLVALSNAAEKTQNWGVRPAVRANQKLTRHS